MHNDFKPCIDCQLQKKCSFNNNLGIIIIKYNYNY